MQEIIAQAYGLVGLVLLAGLHFLNIRAGVSVEASGLGLISAMTGIFSGYLTWRSVCMGYAKLVFVFSVLGVVAGIASLAALIAAL